jgi:hypothetical protein
MIDDLCCVGFFFFNCFFFSIFKRFNFAFSSVVYNFDLSK